MTRDYSQFLAPAAAPAKPQEISTLDALGWQNFFARQTDISELDQTPPARVTEVHRSGLRALGNGLDLVVPPRNDATVGDWLLIDPTRPGEARLLERKSLIKRRAPGSDRQIQLIAANIDTAFIVTSCNQDFNLARLERYIALAFDAEVSPVILLTKPDLSDDPAPYLDQARQISDLVPVISLDARGGDPLDKLAAWTKPGQTVAFLGSSGVGKSTLTNALAQSQTIATQAIREDDARGRHTTTHRHLHVIPNLCAVLDTPGMRELQLTDAEAGVADVFADLHDLATACKFNDCRHETEPGCAVQAALSEGQLDPARMERWKKLVVEERFNSATMAQRKAKDKVLGKTIRNIQKKNRK